MLKVKSLLLLLFLLLLLLFTMLHVAIEFQREGERNKILLGKHVGKCLLL